MKNVNMVTGNLFVHTALICIVTFAFLLVASAKDATMYTRAIVMNLSVKAMVLMLKMTNKLPCAQFARLIIGVTFAIVPIM